MTPKEKARGLANLMYYTHGFITSKIAKQCAIIAVEELIKEEEMFQNGELNPTKYWQEVKEEINNL